MFEYVSAHRNDGVDKCSFHSCFIVPKLTDGICYKLWEPEEYGETNIKTEKKWYFHTPTQTCLQFDYGGCLGNENNYATLEDCQSRNNSKYILRNFFLKT